MVIGSVGTAGIVCIQLMAQYNSTWDVLHYTFELYSAFICQSIWDLHSINTTSVVLIIFL